MNPSIPLFRPTADERRAASWRGRPARRERQSPQRARDFSERNAAAPLSTLDGLAASGSTRRAPCHDALSGGGRDAPATSRRHWWRALWLLLVWAALWSPLAAQSFGDFTYSSDGEAITITGYTGAGGAVAIPDTIAGLPVRVIGNNAFDSKPALTSVTIPNGIAFIGNWAFHNCTSLTNVTIPESVTSIGWGPFGHATALLSIEVAAGNPSYRSVGGVLFNANQTALIQYPAGKAGSYTIPAGVTSIEVAAFRGCEGLTGVTIPESVTSIAWLAFLSCSNLNSIFIPASVTSIAADSFTSCRQLVGIEVSADNPAYVSAEGVLFNKNLTALHTCPGGKVGGYNIPDGVVLISYGAFSGCEGLTGVAIPDSVTSIGLNAFNGCKGLISIVVPNGVVVIEDGVFLNCSNLTSVVLGDDVTSIGYQAFSNCVGLTSVTLPDSVTTIKDFAFADCTRLSSVIIGQSITSIGYAAFAGCTSLTNIVIPYGVTSISDFTFDRCESLANVSISNTLISIGFCAFQSCRGLTNVTIPASVTSIGEGAFYITGLTRAVFEGDAPASFGSNVFSATAPGFTIYYYEGRTGFTSPTWQGYPAVMLDGPGAVTEAAGAVTAHSAVLLGTAQVEEAGVAYFEYGPTSALGQRTAAQPVDAGVATAVELPVAGLQAGTVYYYRLVVETGAGPMAGATVSFTTPASGPLAATGQPANVTATTATLVGGVHPQGLATQVHFEYGATELLGRTTTTQTLPAGEGVTDVTAALTGLNAGGTYFYRIVASNTAGTTRGEIVRFTATTGGGGRTEPTAAPMVTTSGAVGVEAEAALARGQVNARGGSTLVHVEYGLTTAYGSVTPAQGIGNGESAVEVALPLAGLRPGTTYHFRVVAANSLGTTPGADATFTTAFPPPLAVTGEAALVDATTAIVSGTAQARGAAAEVSVDYGLSPESFAFSVAADPATVTGETVTAVTATLPNLRQGVTYYYRVRAVSEGGASVGAVRTLAVTALSGLLQHLPAPVPPAERQGVVLVTLSPTNVGGWRLGGETTWRVAGVPALGLTTGDRAIEYRPVPGYLAPEPEPITVTSGGAAVVVTRTYTPTATPATGALRVTLQPAALAAATVPAAQRAQWRLLGETTWRDSGTSATGLAAGAHVIESKPLTGHATPAPANAEVSDGLTTETTLVYFLAEAGAGTLPALRPYDVAATDAATAFVGQLRGSTGSGSGFAVRPRVVATAAHVVWDEVTLSSRHADLTWHYQADAGAHEPVGLSPRGFILLDGYTAQRAVEGTPGVATPASQHLDAAALFFYDDVARGGFSGFLASDLPVNEYLVSPALKVLAGYPVEGIDPTLVGRFHATSPVAATFTAATGRAYATRDLSGFGGMSGGPLSVWNESAQSWYPAGIYLGGSGQSVVRALDRDVVDLFRLAEAHSIGGDQDVGGGITHSASAAAATPNNQGGLIINIEPDAARAAARWGLNDEAPSRLSGARINVAPDTYQLRLPVVSGFLPPVIEQVPVTSGRLRTYTFTYAPVPVRLTLEAWRRQHFGGDATDTGAAANTADPDGDGFTNEEEYAAATDPRDAGSAFAITTATRDGASYAVTFDARPDRRYVLQRWQPASGAIWQPVDVLAPSTTAGPARLTDPAAPAGAAFYRVQVSLP